MSAGSHYASKIRSRARGKAGGGIQAMGEDLTAIADSVADLSGAWPALGEIWAERQRKVFDTNSFGRWTPLAAATIMRKRRAGISTDTLVRTGSLRSQVSSPAPRNSSTHFVVFGPYQGAPIEYAKYHLRGNGVPQRNPVPRFTPTERKRFIEAIRDYMGMG